MDSSQASAPVNAWALPKGGRKNPIAISHEGVKGDDNVITLAGFQQAFDLGFRYFETDIRLLADGSLVALHEMLGNVEPKDEQEARDAGGLATVRELLDMPDTFWNFELKGDDGTAATVLARELRPGDMHRVLISFGTNLDSGAVAAIRAALPGDACFAASIRERSIDWDAMPFDLAESVDGRVIATQVWHEHASGFKRLFVTASDVREAHHRGLALHIFPIFKKALGKQDIVDLAKMKVDGFMVDHHKDVRDIYEEIGYDLLGGERPWPRQKIDPERESYPTHPTER